VRILTRYILGEILSHTLIGCALFTFILFMKELPHILEIVVRNSSTFTTVMEVVVFTLPNFFMVTIPMAVLVGILLGLSRLAGDSEIVAMRASGLGIGYFVRVASIVAVGGTLLGLGNSLFVVPRANQAILDLQRALASQASYEIQPRVFDEDFRNFVLYVQNVIPGAGAVNWRNVFMADISDPNAPKITTAASATVVSDSSQDRSSPDLLMQLRNGTEDETVAGQPQLSNTSTFDVTDRPFVPSLQNEGHLGRLDTFIYAMSMDELRVRSHGPDSKRFQFSHCFYPARSLVQNVPACKHYSGYSAD
jgi:lipopolysaccharide export LptBFGC system permease protein LptF